MSPTAQGAIVLIATLIVLLCGAPVAFGLGALSIVFLLIFQGFGSLQVVAETFYAGLNDFTLVSIPMFVMMGAAIGKMGIPEMRRRGYPDDIATGSICAGGTLGILIPPSIFFFIDAAATET